MALLTQSFRKVLFDILNSDVNNSNYYVGLAKAEPFVTGLNLDSADQSIFNERRYRDSLICIKRVNAASHVIDYNLWQSGQVYNAYDDSQISDTNFYVVNSSNEVFVCLQKGLSPTGVEVASTIEPTSSLAASARKAQSFKTLDGYVWRWMYEISPYAVSRFFNTDYIPVKKITSASPVISQEVQQKALQDSAESGEILGIRIVNPGSGYSSAPTITIDGNGSGASFTCDVAGGSIVRVRVDSDLNGLIYHGSGYDKARVELSNVSGGAKLEPIFGPWNGLNADPPLSLKSKAGIISTDVQGDESGTLQATNDFRSICLIKNPKKNQIADSDFTSNSEMALYGLNVVSSSGFAEDDTIQASSFNLGPTNEAKAKVFSIDGNTLYYYQDDSTGYSSFNGLTAEVISTIEGSGTGNTQSSPPTVGHTPTFKPYSGELVYIENVSPITRTTGQSEDIRMVIKF